MSKFFNSLLLPTLTLTVGLFITHGHLFFPKPSLYFIPDIGISDSLHLNLPLKVFLSHSLKNFSLPLWNPNIGTGIPQLAEAETGTFFLPNLILFGLLNPYLAWNLSHLLISIIAFWGFYFLARHFNISQIPASIISYSFAFSAFFILHLGHFNLIQAWSLTPWLLLLSIKLIHQPSLKFGTLFSLILSQQIFVGHFQMTFIALLGIIIFHLAYHFKRPHFLKSLTILITAISFGIILASIQLIPSLELKQLSGLSNGSSRVFENPIPFTHLISYLLPNYFGSPATATYPPPASDWGIYWENVHYLGILPFLIIALGIFRKTNINHSYLGPLLILSVTGLILALGNQTPASTIFHLPFFNFFRVTARFLTLVSLPLLLLAGIIATKLIASTKSKLPLFFVFIPTLVFLSLDLHLSFQNFSPTIPLSSLTQPPAILQQFQPSNRYVTHKPSQNQAWNQLFWNQGFQPIDQYYPLLNGADANLNLLYQYQSTQAYLGFTTLRQEAFQTFLNQSLLDASSTKFLITANTSLPIFDQVAAQQPTIASPTYYLFSNPTALERFRFANHYQVMSFQQTFDYFSQGQEFDFSQTVILETDPNLTLNPDNQATLDLITQTPHHLFFSVSTQSPTILVIADSYYPGWLATIDNQPIQIQPANLNQRAIIIPAGDHQLSLTYSPRSFYWGAAISILGHFIGLVFLFRPQLYRQLLAHRRQ